MMNRLIIIILFSIFINTGAICQDTSDVSSVLDSLNFIIEVSYNNNEFGPGYKAEIKTEGDKFYCYYQKNDEKGKKNKLYKKVVNEAFIKETKDRINYRMRTDPDNCQTQTIVKVSHLDKSFQFSFSDCEDLSFDDDFFKLR